MKSTLKAVLCILALASVARADFVVGGGSGLPTGKVDLFPAPNSLNYVSASDWNTGMQALLDLRTKTFNYNIQTITTSQTLTTASSTWNINATGLTITLPTGVTGAMYLIKDVTGNANPNCTISPTNGTIDGAASKVISAAYGWFVVRFNGTNWDVTGQGPAGGGSTGNYTFSSNTMDLSGAATMQIGSANAGEIDLKSSVAGGNTAFKLITANTQNGTYSVKFVDVATTWLEFAYQGNVSGAAISDATTGTTIQLSNSGAKISTAVLPQAQYSANCGSTANEFQEGRFRHIFGGSSAAPTSSSLGTNVTSITCTGNDLWGTCSIVTGGATTANQSLGTITLQNADGTPVMVDISPSNQAAATTANAQWYLGTIGAGTFQIKNVGSLGASTYVVNYQVGG
ncbi:MAG TPA: hypothetical protein VKT80_15140 [Chloroflexota bacterium]|nr:hypothetical protein [Chloroflexota bacterium]